MKTIINLTQHAATPEQAAVGVIDLTGAVREALIEALTFRALPSSKEIRERAEHIAHLVSGDSLLEGAPSVKPEAAMIGGAPYLMAELEMALGWVGIIPLYAFSVRVSSEKDGVKTSVFRHLGFVGGV